MMDGHELTVIQPQRAILRIVRTATDNRTCSKYYFEHLNRFLCKTRFHIGRTCSLLVKTTALISAIPIQHISLTAQKHYSDRIDKEKV